MGAKGSMTNLTIPEVGGPAALEGEAGGRIPGGGVIHLALPPMPAIVVAAFTALRYFGRGAGLQELMVLACAGAGSSLF